MKELWIRLEQDKKWDWLLIVAFCLLLLGVLTWSQTLLITALLIYAGVATSDLYLRLVHRPLHCQVDWTSYRLFPAEKTTLRFQLHNHGRFAIHRAKWSFKLTSKVHVEGVPKTEDSVYHTYNTSFVIGRGEGVAYSLPVTAIKRGVVRIQGICFEMEDPLALGKVKKEVIVPQTDVLIYPEIQTIGGIEKIATTRMGEKPVNRFTHEDPTYILGARPYQSGDPFQRIDWKASARKQELHTKLVDRTAHVELVIIGNVRSYPEEWGGYSEEYLEQSLSAIASVSYYATREGIPYQVLVNLNQVGRKQMFHIPRGEGRSHLVGTLESLARIGMISTTSFEQTVLYAFRENRAGKQFVLITPYRTKELDQLLLRFRQERIPVYLIMTDQETLTLQNVGKGLKKYA